MTKITIFGFADSSPQSQEYQQAFQTAKLLARAGFTIVNGGGPGIMAAASQGAKAGGGKTIGVILKPEQPLPFFEGRDPQNPLDQVIVCHNYLERTLKLLELGAAYLIFNGGTGTISEFGMAWGLARLHFGQHRPLILFGRWWQNIMTTFIKNMHIRREAKKVYRVVDSPQTALTALKELLPKGKE